jgi:hypothetical protein
MPPFLLVNTACFVWYQQKLEGEKTDGICAKNGRLSIT